MRTSKRLEIRDSEGTSRKTLDAIIVDSNSDFTRTDLVRASIAYIDEEYKKSKAIGKSNIFIENLLLLSKG